VDSELTFGIPDIELPWNRGGTVKPSCFAGHQLIVLFLPADAVQQAAELAAYEEFAPDFPETDAWFLSVGGNLPSGLADRTNLPIALDQDGAAWRAFEKVANQASKLDRSKGATFLFTRGGAFHRAWPGQGHARELMDELLTRA